MKNALCYFFSFLVEAVILWQYSSILLSAKRKPRTRIAALCLFYFILFLASLAEIKWLNAALYFLLNYIFLITQYRLKWHTALFHSSILTAVMGMCELMVYGIVRHFAPDFLNPYRDFHHLAVFAGLNKLIFFTIMYVLIHLMKRQEKYSQKEDGSLLWLIFIPIVSVFVMLTLMNVSETSSINWMITLSAVLLLAANLLMFGISQHTRKKSMEFTEMQLLLQKESDLAKHYGMLRVQNENQRILIHDIKKHLQAIDILNEQKEYDRVSAYIRQLILSSDLKEASRLCSHEMLNSILCLYMKQCSDRHIAFHADIRSQTTDFIADSDLTSLFCNLMDNAMEAAAAVSGSFIELSADRRERTPFTIITVINSCRKNPFLSQDGLATHKPDKDRHGYGLKSIRRTISKYHGNMQMYYDDETLTFHTIIALKP